MSQCIPVKHPSLHTHNSNSCCVLLSVMNESLRNIKGNRTPKCILKEICKEKKLLSPSFETIWKGTIMLPHPVL